MPNLPSAIQTLINNASTTFNGKVPWGDTDAVKDILTDINENTAIYGILTVGSFVDLPTYVYGETPIVACVIYDGDATKNGLYIYDGGWTIKAYFNVGKYESTVGGTSALAYSVDHNLNIQYPIITMYDISLGGIPKLVLSPSSLFSSIKATDNNTVTFTFTSDPTAESIKVVIQ